MDGRRTYTLDLNHQTVFPSEIVYFDTETWFDPKLDEQTHKLRLGHAVRQRYTDGVPIGHSTAIDFTTPREFWAFLESVGRARRNVWVMAHNLDFDFAAVEGWKAVEEWGATVLFWAFTPQVFLLRVQRASCGYQFIDSLGFMRRSLVALGKVVGLTKGTMPHPAESDAVWRVYCQRDVAVLKLAFERYMEFVRDEDLGKLALTGPGQALAAYRHRFMGERIVIHRAPLPMQTELASYHGGRVEAFYLGKVPASPVTYLDVNSMYADVMQTTSQPVQLLGRYTDPTPGRVREGLSRYEILCDCTVKLDVPAVPFVDGKLLFPVGRFRTVLAGPEFRLCHDRGYVDRVHVMQVYRRGHPFGGYVDHFWSARKAAQASGDETFGWFNKLLLNSLYGKFGQRNPSYTTHPANRGEQTGLQTVLSTATGRRESRLVFGGKVWLKTGDEPASHSFYAISSWITSAARVKLWLLIEKAGRDHVYYCDTDSLFVDNEGKRRLTEDIAAGVLGALDVREVGKSLTIHGLKDYSLDGSRTTKGIPDKAIEDSAGEFHYTTFDHLRTRLRQGAPDEIRQRTVTKRLTREYTKGRRTPSGAVEPLRVD